MGRSFQSCSMKAGVWGELVEVLINRGLGDVVKRFAGDIRSLGRVGDELEDLCITSGFAVGSGIKGCGQVIAWSRR